MKRFFEKFNKKFMSSSTPEIFVFIGFRTILNSYEMSIIKYWFPSAEMTNANIVEFDISDLDSTNFIALETEINDENKL